MIGIVGPPMSSIFPSFRLFHGSVRRRGGIRRTVGRSRGIASLTAKGQQAPSNATQAAFLLLTLFPGVLRWSHGSILLEVEEEWMANKSTQGHCPVFRGGDSTLLCFAREKRSPETVCALDLSDGLTKIRGEDTMEENVQTETTGRLFGLRAVR